jgi:hypothetical protein
MTEPTITCPACKTVIPLTEQLAAPLLAAERRAIAAREAEVARAREGLAAEIAERLEAERARLAGEEAEKARAAAAAELTELRTLLAARDGKLAEAQKAQAEALRQMRALEDARRELDLTVESRVSEALAAARDAARAAAEEAMRLKVAEKEATITAMQRTIEDLRRRSEQGSQQLQGEVMELDLEAALAARFPGDGVEPVAKGVAGADLIQRVIAPGGTAAGVILWEVKRTKGWNDEWLVKLRADQRALGADVALIMSEALPKGVETFELIDGVWVAAPRVALPLATALRAALIELGAARAARSGQAGKMELVYDYLTGPRFRHRIEAIVEKFTDMAADLDREKKSMQRLWAKRETQIAGVLEATVGLYGDLQGIAGRALGEIEGLEVPLLDGPEE